VRQRLMRSPDIAGAIKRWWRQGITLVHFSAQRKRFLWDRGCIKGLLRGC
jgi:hypothetical protein